MNRRVLVVGSVSRDITVTVRDFPAPGETTIGTSVTYGLGGKGANQAVAAALAGVETTFLGCVGDDAAGAALREALAEHGVRLDHLATLTGEASGTAHITVDARGENSIAVVPAANARLTPDLVEDCARNGFEGSPVVLAQGEIPVGTLEALGRVIADSPARWVLNLAPAVEVSREVLGAADVLIVNESEAAALLARHGARPGTDLAEDARRLTEASPGVVLTAGIRGSYVASRGTAETVHVEATPAATVVDTTGAGDAFAGVFGAALAQRCEQRGATSPLEPEVLVSCARIASREAARVVARPGASASYQEFSLEEA